MQVGCALLSEEDISLAKEIGYDYIELMGKYLVSLSDMEYGKLVQKLDNYQILCQGINAYCPKEIVIAGPGFDIENAYQYAKKCAKRAKEAGAKCIGIGSPNSRNLPEGFPREIALLQLSEFLKVTAEEFGKFNITVCLEALAPCYCNFINTVQEAVNVVKKINWENIRVVLDFYNMEHIGEADEDLADYIPYIAHTHISDDDGAPNRRYFLKEEKAMIHQKRISKLYNLEYKGAISVEVDLPVHKAMAQKSFDIIKKSIISNWEAK